MRGWTMMDFTSARQTRRLYGREAIDGRNAAEGRDAWAARVFEGRGRGDCGIAGSNGDEGRHAEDDARAAGESEDAGGDADPQPGQDWLQGGDFLAGRAGGAGARKQFRCGCADYRTSAGYGRELYRYVFALWRAGALERAVRGQGDGAEAQGGVSGDEDQGADARRFDADD